MIDCFLDVTDIPGMGTTFNFYDGGYGYNNPIKVARQLMTQHPFEAERVACYVSLGTGIRNFEELEKKSGIPMYVEAAKLAAGAATNTEQLHNDARQELTVPYFRFNPESGIGDLPLDSVGEVELMKKATWTYVGRAETVKEMKSLTTLLQHELRQQMVEQVLDLR